MTRTGEAGEADWSGSQRRSSWVLHVDLDQFVAAVEVLRHPELAGKPVMSADGATGALRAAMR